MGDGGDELLRLAREAMRKMRPKRRKMGLVQPDGSVELRVQEAEPVTPDPAKVVPFAGSARQQRDR